MADGGTIFLDEIGEIDPSTQVKLLRVLQDRSYEVLGSSITRTVDMRVVAATNRDLGEQVDKGQFREDLLYRLNLIAVRLPPLRERRGDIPILVRHFLDASAAGVSTRRLRGHFRPVPGAGCRGRAGRATSGSSSRRWNAPCWCWTATVLEVDDLAGPLRPGDPRPPAIPTPSPAPAA